jgi:CRP-like cAMP-binding protein
MKHHTWTTHLRQVPLFADFDDKDFDRLLPLATELYVPAGTVLMRQDSIGHEMVVVLAGVLEVTRDDQHVAEITAGGFAGEMALLTRAPRNSTVTALTDVNILVIDGRGFSTLLREVPSLAVKMLPIVADRLSQPALAAA